MKLSKKWTTVTPLSKLIALGMLVLLPFFGFYLGIIYEQSVQTDFGYGSMYMIGAYSHHIPK